MESIQREGYVFSRHECLIIQNALELAIKHLSKINKKDKNKNDIPQTSLDLSVLQREMEILKESIDLLFRTKEEPGMFSKEEVEKMFSDKVEPMHFGEKGKEKE